MAVSTGYEFDSEIMRDPSNIVELLAREDPKVLLTQRSSVLTSEFKSAWWHHNGNATAAAEDLGISRATAYRFAKQLGLTKRLLNATEVGDMVGLSSWAIGDYCRRGVINGRHAAPRAPWMIERKEAERFRDQLRTLQTERLRPIYSDWLPITKVAEQLGYNEKAIRRMCQRRVIQASKVRGSWQVPCHEVERVKRLVEIGEVHSETGGGMSTPLTLPEVEHFSVLLKRHIERVKVSHEKLGRRCGLTGSYVTRLCAGERTPSREVVDRLAAGLALSGQDWDQFLIAVGYAPTVLSALGRWDESLQAVAVVLLDERIERAERQRLSAEVVAVAKRWMPTS
jgi:transcriptional regulator with XRE-family HTH domain/AraC-like DNA-binding protein